MNTGEERRKFMRLNALVDVIYRKQPPTGEEKLSLTKNISQGGICLIVYEELKQSDLLDLEVHLPDEKAPINAVGRVAWTKEFVIGDAPTGKRFDVGVEFIKAKNEDMQRINKYVFGHAPVP